MIAYWFSLGSPDPTLRLLLLKATPLNTHYSPNLSEPWFVLLLNDGWNLSSLVLESVWNYIDCTSKSLFCLPCAR